jgi:hypothetical protein
MPAPGPVHWLAIRWQYAAPRAAHCAMGGQVGFHGGSSRFRWPSSLALAPEWLLASGCPRSQAAFCTSEAIRPVRLLEINIGTVAYRAIWGYGVGPPSLSGTPPSESGSRAGCRTGRLVPRRRGDGHDRHMQGRPDCARWPRRQFRVPEQSRPSRPRGRRAGEGARDDR